MVIKKNTIIKIYAVNGILLPILFQYSTGIKSFTVGDLLLIFSLIGLVLFIDKIRISRSIIFLLGYVLIVSICMLFRNRMSEASFFTTLRYSIYLLYISLLPNILIEKDFIISFYRKVSRCSILLLYLQFFLFKIANICLPGVIQLFKLTDSSLYDYSYVIRNVNSGRVMSFFGEPSHFAIYVLPFLILSLFYYERNKDANLKESLLASIAIVLSSSFTGIMGMVFVWIVWLLSNIIQRKLSRNIALFGILGILVLFYLVFFTEAGNYIMNEDIFSRQSSGRFEGFHYISTLNSDYFSKLLGNGMEDVGTIVYMAGWPRLVFYFGVLGTFVYALSFISILKKKSLSNIIIILVFILMVGTEMNFSPFIVSYLCLVFVLTNQKMIFYL